jgi:predicted nuclease with RNAse H fold
VLNLEQTFSSFGIEMVDLYPVAAPKTARKEAARVARKAYERRMASKTRADQVAASDAEANAGRGKCLSRPESSGEV